VPIVANLLPAFTSGNLPKIGIREVVSSYSSATASDFHGVPSIHSLRFNLQRSGCGESPPREERQVFSSAESRLDRERKHHHLRDMIAPFILLIVVVFYRVVLGIVGS